MSKKSKRNKNSGDYHKAAMESAGIGFMRLTLDGEVRLLDDMAFRLFELDDFFDSAEKVEGKNIRDLIKSDYPLEIIVNGILMNERIRDYEYCITTLKDNEKWLLQDTYIDTSETTEDKLIQCVFRDVTRRRQVEIRLLKTEQRYKELYNSVPVGLFRLSVNGEIVEYNPAALELFGYTSFNEVKMKKTEDFYYEVDDREEVRNILNRDGCIENMELRLKRKDESVFWASVSISPVKNNKNEVTHYDGIINDISHKKSSEEAQSGTLHDMESLFLLRTAELRESENRLKELLENSGDFIYRFNLFRNEFEYISPSSEKILGFIDSEIIAMGYEGYLNRFHPDDSAIRSKHLEMVEKNKVFENNSFRFEYRFKTKSGEYIWVSENFTVIHDYSGIPSHLVGNARDISALKNREEELKNYKIGLEKQIAARANELLEINSQLQQEIDERNRIFDLSLHLLLIAKFDGSIIRINRGWEDILGYTGKDLLWKSIIDIFHPDDKVQTLAELASLSEGKYLVNFENMCRCKDGSYKLLAWSATSNQANGLIYAIAHDITGRRTAEDALKKSVELYRELVENANIAIVVDDSEGNLEYFNEQFTELFGYSFQEMKLQSIKTLVHPVDLDMVVNFHKSRLKGENVPAKYEFRGIRKDESIIHLVASVVSIDDNGGGDRKGTRTYLWDITEKRKLEEKLQQSIRLEGLGILAGGIARDFNNLLQGIIGNISHLLRDTEEGSTLEQTLKEIEASSNQAAKLTKQMLAFSGKGIPVKKPENSIWLGGGKVLLVDDDKKVLKTTRRMLEKIGFDVTIADSGEQALKLYTKTAGKFNFILLNLNMPGMEGVEIFDRIRKSDKNAKVILSSDLEKVEAKEKFPEKGFAGFIKKPYRMSEIIENIRGII